MPIRPPPPIDPSDERFNERLRKKGHARRQHYVPAFYLAYFARELTPGKGVKLHVLNTLTRKFRHPTGPRAVAYHDYFYAMRQGKFDELSQILEQEFEDTENQFGAMLPEIIELLKSNHQIGHDAKYVLSQFFSMLWIRNPAMRRMLQKMEGDSTKWFMQFAWGMNSEAYYDEIERDKGIEITPEQRAHYRRVFREGDFQVVPSNAQHIHMIGDMEKYARLFYVSDWRVFLSRCPMKFITSDNPVAEILPENPGPFGAHFGQRTFWLSLCPDVCIRVYGPSRTKKAMVRKTIFPGGESEIIEANAAIAHRATTHAYALNSSDLEQMLVAVGEYEKYVLGTHIEEEEG